MNPDIFERIMLSPSDLAIKKLISIPALKNCLYHVKIQENPLYNGFLVAKISSQDIQEVDEYCGLHLANLKDQIVIPSDMEPNKLNLIKYLKFLAQELSTISIYYKRKVYGRSDVWEIEALMFDYRNIQLKDYEFSEHYHEGFPTFGTYVESTKFSKVTCEVENGFKGKAKMPPFEMPLLRIIRGYEFYDWPHIPID